MGTGNFELRAAVFCAVLCLASIARAEGMPSSLPADAAALGRGGTRVAGTSGPIAVRDNPANLSRMFSLGAALGGTGILSRSSGVDGDLRFEGLPHLYAGYGNGQVGAALGVDVPMLDPGRDAVAGHAGGAWQITPELSAGATVSLHRGLGLGVGGGVSWAPDHRLRFGLTGRVPSFQIPGQLALGTALYLDAVRLFADLDAAIPREGVNAFGFRLGAEKDLGATTVLRAGVLFEKKSSIADVVGLTVGAGRDVGPIEADLGYMFVLSRAEDAFAGTHLLALTIQFATPPGRASRSADMSNAKDAGPYGRPDPRLARTPGSS